MSKGALRIVGERLRQIHVEGWDADHDDEHETGLVKAAVCYATGDPTDWPWDARFWKPSDPIRNLEKAGALIAAEIDRLLRAKEDN